MTPHPLDPESDSLGWFLPFLAAACDHAEADGRVLEFSDGTFVPALSCPSCGGLRPLTGERPHLRVAWSSSWPAAAA